MAIARSRSKRTKKRCTEKVSLPSNGSEMASGDLPEHALLERREQVFDLYRKAFSGFSDDETAILDGVILKRPNMR